MPLPSEPGGNSAGSFPQSQPIDRSAAGIGYQKYTMSLNARGDALGMGRRVAPDPSAQFRNPPISGSQFGGGSNAKASFSSPEESY